MGYISKTYNFLNNEEELECFINKDENIVIQRVGGIYNQDETFVCIDRQDFNELVEFIKNEQNL